MRVGDAVLYVETPGKVVEARVTAVVGAGPSGYKELDLVTATGRVYTCAPYVRDSVVAAGYWCQHPEEVRPLKATTEWSMSPPARAADEQEEE